ncbi:MAG: hypothetical protein ACYC27_14685 [Armatimonadota bacterium]
MLVRYLLALAAIGQIDGGAIDGGDISVPGEPSTGNVGDTGSAAQPSDKGVPGGTAEPVKPAEQKVEPSVADLKKSLRAVTMERNAALKAAKSAPVQDSRLQAPSVPGSGKEVPAEFEDGYVDAGTVMPSLKGLKYDPKDREVELDGTWMSPRQANAILIAEKAAEREQQSQRSQEEQGIEAHRSKITQSIRSDIGVSVKAIFPNVSERVGARMNAIVEDAVAQHMYEAGIAGAFDPYDLPEDFETIITEGIAAGMKEAREFVYELQNPQAVAQEKAGQREPVGPGGKAGQAAPVSMSALPPEKRREARVGIVENVMHRLGVK